ATQTDFPVTAVQVCLRRNTSRILRIDTLLPGMNPSLIISLKKGFYTIWFYASLRSEIGDRNGLESVTGIEWNRWPE
ncbi:hypothetical protein JWJ90_22725, partial [Desulfobulbus rhabdoformis]|uniref:hypothetical protein n=1 Tax=Desulfobulbus rhabdoformis TaxID=34032 RepID=UPI001966016C